MSKILLIQGPNMTFLGRREPEYYGTTTAAELDAMLTAHAEQRAYELGCPSLGLPSSSNRPLLPGSDVGWL